MAAAEERQMLEGSLTDGLSLWNCSLSRSCGPTVESWILPSVPFRSSAYLRQADGVTLPLRIAAMDPRPRLVLSLLCSLRPGHAAPHSLVSTVRSMLHSTKSSSVFRHALSDTVINGTIHSRRCFLLPAAYVHYSAVVLP
jgi:hypothetical protein